MHPLRVIQKKLKLKEYFLFTFLLLRSEKSRLSPFFKTIFWHKNWMTFKLNTSETGVWIKRRKYFNLTILLSLGSNQIISRLFFSIFQNDKKKMCSMLFGLKCISPCLEFEQVSLLQSESIQDMLSYLLCEYFRHEAVSSTDNAWIQDRELQQ